MIHLIMSFMFLFRTKVGITITQIDGAITSNSDIHYLLRNKQLYHLHLNKYRCKYQEFSEEDFPFLE